MTVRVTAARARQLGLFGPGEVPTSKKGRSRKTVPAAECGATHCCTCNEVFRRRVDEDRHFERTQHHRYGCDITVTQ